MAVATNSSVMVVRYHWILESIEIGPKVISSKMILFRGQEVFRVALKNEVERQTLIFMAIKLNKLGMKVEKVFYSNTNHENSMEMEEKNDGIALQVFSVAFYPKVFEKTTFTFEIEIKGTVTDFSFQLADQLLKNQLWMAVKKCQWTDIDLIVQGKTISAHKCVLAARSPVFATKFHKDRKLKQIAIDDVDFLSVEQFLYFLYTGEVNKSFDNEQLFMLAKRYKIATLASLCKNALVQIDAEEITRHLISLYPNNDSIASFEIRPMKDTELYFDPNTFTFLADWNLIVHPVKVGPVFFGPKQQEKLFSVHFVHKSLCEGDLRLFCTNSRNSGCQVVEAVYSFNKISQFSWKKMERSNVQERGLIFKFSTTITPDLQVGIPFTISFRIKITSIIANYHHEMIDTTCATQLWTAATNRQLTDVEISVGSHKFEAHRVVLAARSTVFDAKLNENQTIAKSSITVCETVDPEIFQHFLKFLYTGTLQIPACNKQLLGLAETYKVETLKNLCQSANQELDVEDVTTSILAANCPFVIDT